MEGDNVEIKTTKEIWEHYDRTKDRNYLNIQDEISAERWVKLDDHMELINNITFKVMNITENEFTKESIMMRLKLLLWDLEKDYEEFERFKK